MTDQPLFLDTSLRLEKVAGAEVRLSEDPSVWQREIAAELYKQAPFVSAFSVNIILDKVNPERGYGMGMAKITTSSAQIIVPVLVRDRMLKPIDIFFVGGVAQPLTEDRLRRATFTTAPVSLTNDRYSSNQGMVSALYPPLRTSFGFGNEMTVAADQLQKLALLREIAPTIPLDAREKVAAAVDESPALRHALTVNPAFASAVLEILDAPVVEKVAESPTPTVVQLERTRSGYMLKHASLDAYAPSMEPVPGLQAQSMFGKDVRSMKPGDTKTFSTDQAAPAPSAGEPLPITSYGRYTCWDAKTNKALVGTVFPLLSYEGKASGMLLFLPSGEEGASGFAIQDRIAGMPADGDPTQLNIGMTPLEKAPVGDGFPIIMAGDVPLAYLPVEVSTVSNTQGNVSLHGTSALGEEILLNAVEELKLPQVSKDGIAVPASAKWFALEGEALHLMEEPFAAITQQQGQGAASEATVRGGQGGSYDVSGAPVAGLPSQETSQLKTAAAKFLLVGLGLDEEQVSHVLETADDLGTVKVAGLRTAYPPRPLIKKAAKSLNITSLVFDLIKEAAVIDDYDSVDKALSLGFLSEENLESFRSHLPTLDSGVTKLCELLLAARIGMTQIPEQALERAVKAMDKVVTALRGMQN